ncbi:MAG: hypothetical protein WDN28_00145 [Chthoniobacter sp.]
MAQAVRANTLGIDLAAIHPELAGLSPADLLPPVPSGPSSSRHHRRA